MSARTSMLNAGRVEHVTALSPSKLVILIPYGLCLWVFAWSLIHFRGPHGLFEAGWREVLLIGTIPTTIVLNWLHLKLTGLPKTEIVNAVTITLATATTIDAACFTYMPGVYGTDPTMLRKAAAYIIWAGVVACVLAFITLQSAQREQGHR